MHGRFLKFILLPINKWKEDYAQVNIGASVDHSDYYNSRRPRPANILPRVDNDSDEPLYLGFFIPSLPEAISGYGGIKHCLIPSPKHICRHRTKRQLSRLGLSWRTNRKRYASKFWDMSNRIYAGLEPVKMNLKQPGCCYNLYLWRHQHMGEGDIGLSSVFVMLR